MEVDMNTVPLAVTAMAALLAGVPAQQSAENTPFERPFVSGGTIRLNLSAADYRIQGRPEEKIRVSWRLDRPEQGRQVQVAADVTGRTAVVRTSGPKNGLHFTIELPERSDLDVDLSAGDLDVRGIEGNKTLSMWAGDVTMDVGRPELYRDVEASVRFGDISAHPFQVTTGGVFRSFKWTGSGKYSVRAKLFAGDLTLR
jgi:hypothetical protein